MKRLLAVIALLFAAPVFCQTAAEKISAGRAALAAHDLAAAQARFQEALEISPTSQAAGALLGLTRVFAVTGQTSSTAFLNTLGVSAAGRDVYDWTAHPPTDANNHLILPADYNLTTVEAFWQGTLIPTTTAARGNLALVTNPYFLLTLHPAETTLPAAVTIDYGDVLMLRAGLSAVEFLFQFLSSQDLRANAAAINQLAQGDLLTLQRILADNPDLLKVGPLARRAAAQATLNEVIAIYREASAFIRARPAGIDRLFMLDPTEFAAEADFRAKLVKLERSLTEPVATDQGGDAVFIGPVFGATWSVRDRFPAFSATGFDLESIVDTSLGGVASGLTREQIAHVFEDLEQGWNWMGPNPPGNTLNRHLTLASGRRIVAGGDGTVLTSDDGTSWVWRFGAMPRAPRILGLAEGAGAHAGKIVAVGGAGRILLSVDSGVTWRQVLEGFATYRGVAYGEGRFVAVSNDGGSATSTDGENWQLGSAYNLGLFDVIHVGGSPGYFLAVGSDGALGGSAVVVTSTDGINWTNRLTAAAAGYNFVAVTQSGTNLVAVGTANRKAVSATKAVDTAWTEGTMVAAGTPTFSNATYSIGDQRFIASGPGGVVATSADNGATWVSIASGETINLNGVGVAPEGVYFAANAGVLLRSGNLSAATPTFVRVLDPAANTTFNSFRAIDGKLYGVGSGDAIRVSSDGQNFSAITSGTTGVSLWGLLNQGGRFYVVGGGTPPISTGIILTSPDGAAPWTPVVSNNTPGDPTNSASNLRFIDYLNGQFVASGTGGIILTSPTGLDHTWTSHATGGSGTIYSVAYGNGRYVAVGGNDVAAGSTNPFPVSLIYTSTDNGATWVARPAGTTRTLRAVVFHQGSFTAVGFDGTIVRSADGIAWNFVTSGAETHLVALRVLDGRYYALQRTTGSTFSEVMSAVLVSSDGLSWARVEQRTSITQFALELFNGRLHTGGGGASVLRSAPLAPTGPPVMAVLTPGRQVNQGGSIALAVTGTGGGSLVYQWKKGGVDVPGATDPTLNLANVQPGDAGNFTLTVTNSAGDSATSPAIAVTVNPVASAPVIATHPQPQTVNVGLGASLTVEATGTTPFSYQWRKDGVDLGGATAATLSFPSLQAAHGGTYTVTVTNPAGTTPSLPAVLNVDSNPAYDFTTLAGLAGVWGAVDGTGAAARFNTPSGVVVDAAGNLYVGDPSNHAIRKVTPAGVVSTFAGSLGNAGNTDAAGTAARFNWPHGVALDAAGANLYVADTNNSAIRKIEIATGVVTTFASAASNLNVASPQYLVVDGAGNVYVTLASHVIRKITPAGEVSTQAGLGGSPGLVDAVGTAARFKNPQGIVGDAAGNLYVADSGNFTIRKIAPDRTVSTFAGQPFNGGFNDGPVASATFFYPCGLALDSIGALYVSDNQTQTIRQITPGGLVRTLGGQGWWSGSQGGVGADARFAGPTGLALDATGNLYVADSYNATIRKGTPLVSPFAPIVGRPQSQRVLAGGSVTFSVGASGVTPLTYQWRKDGGAIAGATNATLALTNVQTTAAGAYAVLVSNAAGAALSAPARLTVTVPPAIAVQPQPQTVTSGQGLTLGVTATDSGTITYQWRRNGIGIVGAYSASYTIPAARRADAGTYDVVLHGSTGEGVSRPVAVAVAPTSYPGQFAVDPTWDPNPVTISTRVYAALPLADGKWLAAGEFVRWDNSVRTGLARLNSDFTLDTSWPGPVVNGIVHALARAPDGTVYFGGDFTAVDGHLRAGLARLLGSGLSHDLAWRSRDTVSPAVNQVSALAVQDDGKLLVARMSFVAGAVTGTNVLHRLNLDGTQDTSFSTDIVLSGSQRLYTVVAEPGANAAVAFGGAFTSVNGATRNGVARVNSTGATLDAAFGGTAGTNNTVFSLTRLSDGRYLVAGQFNSIGGLSRNRIALLDATTGAVNPTFVPLTSGTTNGNVLAAAMLSDGRIFAAGNFTQYQGNNAAGFIRLNGTTGAFDSALNVGGTGPQTAFFNPTTAGRNLTAYPLSGDAVALFGIFNQILGERRVGVAVVNANGTLAATPNSLAHRPAYTGGAFLEPDGRLTVFGSADIAGGQAGLGQILRLNPNGTVDPGFPGGTGFGLNGLSTFGVYRAIRQGDGKYVAIGDFVSYNGAPASRLVRINPNGTIDDSFHAGSGPSSHLTQLIPLGGGKVMLYSYGSGFTYDGLSVSGNIMRVNSDGSRDATFHPGAGFNSGPSIVCEFPANESPAGGNVYYVAGSFTTYDGAAVPGLVRLAADGTRDATFNAAGTGPTGGIVTGLTLLRDGRLLLHGSFTAYNGTAVNRLAIVNAATGALDPAFTSPADIDAQVNQVLVQEDGKYIVTGDFSAGPALRLNDTGARDSAFALRGITGFPGGSGGARLIMADDGSLYLHNTLVSLDYGPMRGLVRFQGAATAPVIAVPPAGGAIVPGVTNLLWLRATGTAPYTYQWRKDGSAIPGATDSVLALPNATAADAGSYTVVVTGPAGSVTSAPAGLSLVVAPAIATPPQSQAVGEGQPFTLHVGVSGTPPFTYQWLKDGNPIGGATGATYAVASAVAGAAGSAGVYSVAVTNAAGSATSAGATVTVIGAGISATHAVAGGGYVAGGTVTVTNTIAYTGEASALDWQVLLPAGWNFASDGGAAGDVKPQAGQTDMLEWGWTPVPAGPITFSYTLNVPAATTGDRSLVALMILRQGGPALQILARPDPLNVPPATNHSADTDRDFRISLLELTRAIELYNTRIGTTRTGAYKIDAAGEDGYNPDPTRLGSTVVTLASYHSADSDRNGKLSLFELTRVIELYNFRSGTTRTGQYHVQSGTEDGFAPGP